MAIGDMELSTRVFSVAIGDMELSTRVFPNTHAWEQQELNKIKKQTKKVRREA